MIIPARLIIIIFASTVPLDTIFIDDPGIDHVNDLLIDLKCISQLKALSYIRIRNRLTSLKP